MRSKSLVLFVGLMAFLVLAAVVYAQTPQSISIKWSPVTTMNDGTPIPAGVSVSYNLYGAHAATGPWSAPIAILGTSTTRMGVAIGLDCYYITAVVSGKESLPTPTQCVTVTAAAASTVPATPLNVTITQSQPIVAPQKAASTP